MTRPTEGPGICILTNPPSYIKEGQNYQLQENSKPENPLPSKIVILDLSNTSVDIPADLNLGDREIHRLVSSNGSISQTATAIMVTVSVEIPVKDLPEFDRWYEEEHIQMLTRIPGWMRSRRFRLFDSVEQRDDPGGLVQCLAIHEYHETNGLGGPEHKASMSTPWREKMRPLIMTGKRGVWNLISDVE